MPKKRKSGGKSGSSKGKYNLVQCSNCGKLIPRSKAKAFTKKISLVDYRMYSELKKQGALIQTPVKKSYLCVSCAIHKGRISQRAKVERKGE